MWRRLESAFFAFPGRLDAWLRGRDLRTNRTEGSFLHKAGFVEGYSPLAMFLPIPVIVALAYGMPRWRGLGLALGCVVAFALHLAIARWALGRGLPILQWLLHAFFALAVFFAADGETLEIDHAPYRHVFAILGTIGLSCGMPASRWLAEALIGSDRDRLRKAFMPHLQTTQFFVTKKDGPPSPARILRAYALVPITSPSMLALFPSFAVVAAPGELVGWFFWIALVLTWVALASVHYDRHLQSFQVLVRQAFLVGAPAGVSALVIVLAAARILNIDYVTTVLDQASLRVILSLAGIFYLIFWLYDYWVQRAAAEVLLGLLTDEERYPQRVHFHGGRMGEARLQIHGAGRLIAIRDSDAERSLDPTSGADDETPNFESYRPIDVFHRIHEQLECRARASSRERRRDAEDERGGEDRAGAPITWEEFDRVGHLLDALVEKTRLHAALPALALILVLSGFGYRLYTVEQRAALAVGGISDAALFDLGEALRAASTAGDDSPYYALAFSGGGTRAALYSYAVMRGMHDRGALDRVLLMSSVSGGSAGVAFFASHRDRLARSLAMADGSWEEFREAMAAPYIQDVLSGLGEWRFMNGTRLGQLLTESFGRAFHPGGEGCRTLGCVTESSHPLGLVFNTGVTGFWKREGDRDPCLEEGRKLRECARLDRAGSRLVITNVASLSEGSTESRLSGWPLDLDYAVVRAPETPLATAASLSANFSPVFSNAKVDVTDGETSSYWVTDGGAIDSRGLVSLLLALRSALDELAATGAALGLPPLRVVVADASGLSIGYREDRGLGAVGSASARITNKLVAELASDVRVQWSRLGGASFELVYLPLPEMLRVHFGTHWQMPRSIEVSDPRLWYDDKAPTIELDEELLKRMMDLLFADPTERNTLEVADQRSAELLWEWVAAGRHGDPRVLLDAAVGSP